MSFDVLMRKTAYAAPQPLGASPFDYAAISIRDDKLTVTHCDGYRLARASFALESAPGDMTLAVPVAVARGIARRKLSGGDLLKALRAAHVPNVKLPDYDRVIPAGWASVHVVKRADLLDALETASALAPEPSIFVRAKRDAITFCGVLIDAAPGDGAAGAQVRESYLCEAARACAGARHVTISIAQSGSRVALQAAGKVASFHLIAALADCCDGGC